MVEKTKKTKKLRLILAVGISQDIDYFTENLSMLVASGMPIINAIQAIGSEMKTRLMRKIADEIVEDILAGSPLWVALENTGIMPIHTISLIRLGEESGKLAENLKIAAFEQEKDRIFKSKIRSAMMYPVFVLTLTLIIGIGVAWFILPRLAVVFSQMYIELPFITDILIRFGSFLGKYGQYAIPAFIVFLFFLIYFVFYFSKTKVIGQIILFSAPGVSRLIREVELARFGYLLGTLLKAGLPVVNALNSLESATVSPHYRKLCNHLTRSIGEGNSFQSSFANFPGIKRVLPGPVQQMIIAGEKSGNLAETLLKIGESYEAKSESTTKNLSVILEPVLLVIVWLGVVAVALAVILPIYSLIGGLNSSGGNNKNQSPAPSPAQIEVADVEKTETALENKDKKIEILPTGKGSLNVRETPSLDGKIISKAKAKENYVYKTIKNDWYEIILADGKTGWVAAGSVEELK